MAGEEHLTQTKERAGTGPGAMWLALLISIALVVIGLAMVPGFGFR